MAPTITVRFLWDLIVSFGETIWIPLALTLILVYFIFRLSKVRP